MNAFSLGGQIRAARLKMRLTQNDLAEKLGCSRGHISNLEHDLHEPSFKLYRKLVKVLNLVDR